MVAIDGRPDLAMVETLARLQLAASRLGLSVHLQHASQELCELLDFVGLGELLLEARGKAERGEQLGVEEVVEPGNPVA